MKNRLKLIVAIALTFSTFCPINAIPPRLVVKTHIYKDGIAVRWTPSSYELWRKWDSCGYHLERYLLTDNKDASQKAILIGGQLISSHNTANKTYISNTKPELSLIKSCLEIESTQTSKATLLQELEQKDQCYIFSMLALQKDFELTIATGLGAIDQTTESNSIYLYKLYPNKANSIDTQFFLVNTNQIREQPQIKDFDGSFSNNRITLQWATTQYNNDYFAYQIERSLDSGKTYLKLNELPLVPNYSENESISTSYFDTIAQYNQLLMYRVKGINYFGQLGAPSLPDTIIAYYETMAYPQQVGIELPSSDSIHITWTFDPLEEKNIKGFKLSVSDSSEGDYTVLDSIILLPNDRNAQLKTDRPNFYIKVSAITMSNNYNSSYANMVQQVDSTPPPIPSISSYSIDSSGIVKLSWLKNKTSDLFAYRVYQSNSRNDEFALVTPMYSNDTIFIDTIPLNFLRDSIYYRLSSIDTRYNESQLGPTIPLSITHQIPPAPPLIVFTDNKVEALHIKWKQSSSSGIVQQYLKLRNLTTGEITNKTFTPNDSSYIDSSLTGGNNYELSLFAKHRNGTSSKSARPIEINRPKNPWMPAIENLTIYNDTIKNKVDLFWNYPYDKEVKHYRIIAKQLDGSSTTIGTINGGNNFFSHFYLKPYTMNQYYIIAYFKDGRRSKL